MLLLPRTRLIVIKTAPTNIMAKPIPEFSTAVGNQKRVKPAAAMIAPTMKSTLIFVSGFIFLLFLVVCIRIDIRIF